MAVKSGIIRGAGTDLILRDGRSLYVRPVRPDDKERLKEFFYRLTPESRYLRFQYTKPTISDEEVK